MFHIFFRHGPDSGKRENRTRKLEFERKFGENKRRTETELIPNPVPGTHVDRAKLDPVIPFGQCRIVAGQFLCLFFHRRQKAKNAGLAGTNGCLNVCVMSNPVFTVSFTQILMLLTCYQSSCSVQC